MTQLLEHGGAHDARLEGGGCHGRRHGDGLLGGEERRWGEEGLVDRPQEVVWKPHGQGRRRRDTLKAGRSGRDGR